MDIKIKNGLITFLFIILFLPFIQQYFPFITSGILYGFSPNAPNTDFSWDTWLDGTYQEKKGRYLNDETGFRPDLIRFNNQVDYSLLDKVHSWKVVVGTNRSIYMDTYIDCYFGRDYAGYDAIHEKMRKIKAISDTLAHLGKSLVLVYSPSKEFMYPEYIPERYRYPPRDTTNFETCLRVGDSLKVNQIDFNTWFYSMRNTSKEILYPKQGVHWSVYGSYLAADSLIKYIEQLRNIRMPHPVWTKIERTDKPRDSDNDIAKTLNLIFPIATETLSYPEVSYPEDATMTKPKVIYVGDSFLQVWIKDGIMDHTNSSWEVWQWFNLVFNKNTPDEQPQNHIDNYDWIKAMNNTDCIVIMYTSISLSNVGHGFIEKAYDYYFPAKK